MGSNAIANVDSAEVRREKGETLPFDIAQLEDHAVIEEVASMQLRKRSRVFEAAEKFCEEVRSVRKKFRRQLW